MEDKHITFTHLLALSSPQVKELATQARNIIRQNMPGASEETDLSANLLGFTFVPGTYIGMPVAIIVQKDYINIMFAKGVELLNVDANHLLEGTGKQARHIKVRSLEQLNKPALVALIKAAVARTQRK